MFKEDIYDTLEKAMKDYFDFTIHIDVENDTVSICFVNFISLKDQLLFTFNNVFEML